MIPMPGHPVAAASEESVKAAVDTLERLFDEHDVIYLLMDSRESRWLPTVLGSVKNKIVINAALGFDSYLVMRHGPRPNETDAETETPAFRRLGCYYCNDIVAPMDVSSRYRPRALQTRLTFAFVSVFNGPNARSDVYRDSSRSSAHGVGNCG
jgi:hypothetical protein